MIYILIALIFFIAGMLFGTYMENKHWRNKFNQPTHSH